MSRVFAAESSFTSTIASLAPSPSSGETLLPGALYVLVSAMASSIVVRNRNILLRGASPVVVGIAAGWVLLPVTMGNVAELVWGWEQRVPVVAENHLRVRKAVEGLVREGKGMGGDVVRWAERGVGEVRKGVEGLVRDLK
jgi:organizing structure protein 2